MQYMAFLFLSYKQLNKYKRGFHSMHLPFGTVRVGVLLHVNLLHGAVGVLNDVDLSLHRGVNLHA